MGLNLLVLHTHGLSCVDFTHLSPSLLNSLSGAVRWGSLGANSISGSLGFQLSAGSTSQFHLSLVFRIILFFGRLGVAVAFAGLAVGISASLATAVQKNSAAVSGDTVAVASASGLFFAVGCAGAALAGARGEDGPGALAQVGEVGWRARVVALGQAGGGKSVLEVLDGRHVVVGFSQTLAGVGLGWSWVEDLGRGWGAALGGGLEGLLTGSDLQIGLDGDGS